MVTFPWTNVWVQLCTLLNTCLGPEIRFFTEGYKKDPLKPYFWSVLLLFLRKYRVYLQTKCAKYSFIVSRTLRENRAEFPRQTYNVYRFIFDSKISPKSGKNLTLNQLLSLYIIMNQLYKHVNFYICQVERFRYDVAYHVCIIISEGVELNLGKSVWYMINNNLSMWHAGTWTPSENIGY